MNGADTHLQDEINKRLTLNLLIQGSAQHAFLTSHHLVRDELNAINKDLVRLYDQIALGGYVQYWSIENVCTFGRPNRFWKRIARSGHLFSSHPFLVRHSLDLVRSAKKRADEKCRIKGVSQLPLWFSLQFFTRIVQTMYKEKAHKPLLVDLAKRTTAQVWGVPTEKLDGAITQAVSFGKTRVPSTFRGLILRTGAAGYGGVLNDGSELKIVGKGWVWPILSHELVKATCELICMHGLNELDQSTYEKVVDAADRIEYEPWMLQVGPELWRRLLALLPPDRPLAEMVMHIARLPALSLEELIFDIVENESLGRVRLANLGRYSELD